MLFVREVFGAKPDAWQARTLRLIAKNPRVAMKACKGPGKSCVLAWVIWWFLVTRENSQIICVSITKDNLKDNLWKELATWYDKSEDLQRLFSFGTTHIRCTANPKLWWCSARSFPRDADASQQANTLAGFHADSCMFVLDEVSDYPPGVLPAAEAIFANEGDKRGIVAGNPTRRSGPLYDICTKSANYWKIVTITGDPDDPERSPRISMEWAIQEIERWGRDNPYVIVNILGEFPPGGIDQLIDVNLIDKAMRRDVGYLTYSSSACVWGLDPARSEFGDESCLMMRQGVLSRRPRVWRGLDGTQLGDQVAFLLTQAEEDGKPCDALFIDAAGVGSSVLDRLNHLGYSAIVHEVQFAGKAHEPDRYLNVRAEIWWRMMLWLKNRPACLADDPLLREELMAPKTEWKPRGGKTVFQLESKDSMAKRGVKSPNRADALALTFTAPVQRLQQKARDIAFGTHAATKCKTDYDPFAGL